MCFSWLCSISKRVYCYDPSIRHIQTFLNAVFVKNKFFQHHDASLPSSSDSYIHDFTNSLSQDLNLRFIYEEDIMKHLQKGTPIVGCLPTPNPSLDPLPLCRSIWPTRPPNLNGFPDVSLLATLSSIFIHNSYLQAVKENCWQQAIQEELDELRTNYT